VATLSEVDSKRLLIEFGAPVLSEFSVDGPSRAIEAATQLGYPVVAKLCGDRIAHKTERGLIRLGLSEPSQVATATEELLAAALPEDGEVEVLIAPMVAGKREFIAGLFRDPQFGPTVMFGLGGIAAEALKDVVFRPAPLDQATARGMLDDLKTQALLYEFRGDAAVDIDVLVELLVGLGRLGATREDVLSVDINPIIVTPEGRPVAVDALVEVAETNLPPVIGERSPQIRRVIGTERFDALFEPRGVVVTGASTHPGKFGFVSLHNILASGYRGQLFATNLQREEVLGCKTVADVREIPPGVADLAFICTPSAANPEILRACADRGITAAFLTSAGYGEAGDEGREAERELVALADELGILLAGPNGQGVVSTPVNLCAQIVAPMPPRGSISVASQSGNFVSSFLNLARVTGVGIARAVSAGNAAAVSVADYLDYFADDAATSVCLAYLEGISDGRALMDRLGAVADRKPLVILKGGATEGGARAAASHTGAMAADDLIFDGACRAAGLTRAATVEEAFETAATFATQPLPKGPNVVVLTTVGGWGVVTADAVTRNRHLRLLDLPGDLLASVDELLPPRWSRNNPIDCAGGETRETITQIMELVARHEQVDAVIYLGIGIQSNQARFMREGPFFPDHGLERIVSYHERQDARFAEAAAELSSATGKPILVATELAIADPSNPGPATVRDTGRLCYPSGDRAVAALGHLAAYASRDRRHL
jgi:acyl-CoA synthetase (NDP forming)